MMNNAVFDQFDTTASSARRWLYTFCYILQRLNDVDGGDNLKQNFNML